MTEAFVKTITESLDTLSIARGDLIGCANDLEDIWLNDHAEKVRETVGELENISHLLCSILKEGKA